LGVAGRIHAQHLHVPDLEDFVNLLQFSPLDQARFANVEEAEHHHLTFILGQADRLVVDGLQREIRGRIAHLEEALRLSGGRQHPYRQNHKEDTVEEFHRDASIVITSDLNTRGKMPPTRHSVILSEVKYLDSTPRSLASP